MWLTVLLGVTFLGFQVYEYIHAYTRAEPEAQSSGAYGSTFFMLTGFHGFHVFVGMLMLLFITIRLMKGHFTPQRHFGFEGAAWYWHFVDVVWLGLYIVVYWLCSEPGMPRSQSAAERGVCFLALGSPAERDARRLDPADPVAQQNEREQQHRQRDAQRQRAHHVAALAACRLGRRAS